MSDFKPADNYHALLRQAMGLNSMVKAMESELALLRRQVNPDLLADLEQQVDSERAANARLTEELEKRAAPLDAKPNPDCRDMVAAYLRQSGFDGLFCEECGCSVDDLMPCGENDWVWSSVRRATKSPVVRTHVVRDAISTSFPRQAKIIQGNLEVLNENR